MICQEINCKKQESKNHLNTLCKKHAEMMEKSQNQRGFEYDIFEYNYKTINEKNKVWKNGHEYVRSIRTNWLNSWIEKNRKTKESLKESIEILNQELSKIEDKINDDIKTKNMRFVK